METTPRTVTSLQLGEAVPFDDWLAGLRDAKGKGQAEYRINKVRRGCLENTTQSEMEFWN